MVAPPPRRTRYITTSRVRLQNLDSVTFFTFHVHLCEVKQCLKAFGLKMLQRILQAVRECDDSIRKQLRDAHNALMHEGYVGQPKAAHPEVASQCLPS